MPRFNFPPLIIALLATLALATGQRRADDDEGTDQQVVSRQNGAAGHATATPFDPIHVRKRLERLAQTLDYDLGGLLIRCAPG